MIINDFEIQDIGEVANLHSKTLVSPSSKIGKAYLKRLYAILLSDLKTHICLVASKKGQIMGSVTATKDLEKTNKLLGKLFSFSMLLSILKALIFRKVTIPELVKRFIFERVVINRFPKPYVSILILFVDKKYQRLGIGRRLTDVMLKKLKKIGVKKVYVDTLTTNNKGFLFYKSLGFVEKKIVIDSRILGKQL